MVNNDEEVLAKLTELEKETKLYIKPLKKVEKQKREINIGEFGLKLKLPRYYEASKETGILRYYYPDGVRENVHISPILIVINKLLKNIDTGEEKAELLLFKKGSWEKLIVEKNVLCNTNNLVNLANKGIPVTSVISRELVNWFYSLEMANYNEISVERTTNRMGWIDNKTFIPYKCNDVSLDFELGIGSWLNRLSETKGTLEDWKTEIKEFLDDDQFGIIRFIMASRF